jgi:twitching motility protein PilU
MLDINTPYLKYLVSLLSVMMQQKGSDLFLLAGNPPAIRIKGKLSLVGNTILNPTQTHQIALSTMNAKQQALFLKGHDCNFALNLLEKERFRFNVYQQKNSTALVIRHINQTIPSFEQLHLPSTLKDLVSKKSGLILICGGTGAGKSTTMATMIDHRNQTDPGHIVCLEDPIEFVHESKRSIISQREIGNDVDSWLDGLKSALRQSPDVLMLGETRDKESLQQLLEASSTGHLCMATLHAYSVTQAIERMLQMFEGTDPKQILLNLSEVLVAIVVQRLLPQKNGMGRMPAIEVMVNTPVIADAIAEHKLDRVLHYVSLSSDQGMITMDQSLLKLLDEEKISQTVAFQYASSPGNLKNLLQTTSRHAEQYQEIIKGVVSNFSLDEENTPVKKQTTQPNNGD